MYIRTSSFVSLETTFYLRVIVQGFVDPIMQQVPAYNEQFLSVHYNQLLVVTKRLTLLLMILT